MIRAVVWLGRAAGFLAFYAWELVVSTLRVAYDVLTPTLHMRPAILAVPLDVRSDLAITLLANLVSLTPGSLTLDVSADRRTLYVHVMFVGRDADDARRAIKRRLERRVAAVVGSRE
jgi:multicomponent Na+:H+ antiporter subunit E